MGKYKFAFVILHYHTIDDTKKCVESIFEKCKNKHVEIVIVDNASKNGTGKELEFLYKDNSKIHVIINKENLGFSKGNNIGFKYAKEKLSADFIIMCNNDTYLLQENFLDLIIKEYETSSFAVLGPKVLLPNNKINPIIKNLPTVKKLKKQLIKIKLDYITSLLYINKVYIGLKDLLKNVLIKLKLKKKIELEDDTNKRYENIVLHGCFFIFSKKYIEKFDGLDDRTFLYGEEELLAIRLKNNNLKSVYNPEIEIFHNEDSATNTITKNNRKKKIFVCKNQIKSMKILLEEMENKRGII